jgi:hypothetical protein
LYDSRTAKWRYLHLRADKNTPNTLTVVLGVFAEQAENISIEELEYRCVICVLYVVEVIYLDLY